MKQEALKRLLHIAAQTLQSSSSGKMEEYNFHLPLLNSFFCFIFCSRITVEIAAYKPPQHLSPEVADSPGSCICPVFFRCRGLKIDCLDKISDWLYFIEPCCI